MAGIASHSLIDMNAVVEIDEIRQIIHSSPHQRFASPKTLADWLQHRGLGPYLSVAIHAGLGCWHSCKPGVLYRSVTVTAINAQSPYMVLMAERRRLGSNHAGVSNIWRALHLGGGPKKRSDHEDCSKNGRARN